MNIVKKAEGKTKIIWPSDEENKVIMEQKASITAGDGVKKEILPGKDIWSNTTTCNCFRALEVAGVPTHFVRQLGENKLLAWSLDMFPIELVARRRATGSCLKRNPAAVEGERFEKLPLEMFWKDDALHDPLMIWNVSDRAFDLYDPKCSPSQQSWLGQIAANDPRFPIEMTEEVIDILLGHLSKTFLTLEQKWAEQNVDLIDIKIECGLTFDGRVVVGDVIDNDSWRIWPDGKKEKMLDKQVFRDFEGEMGEVAAQLAANYAKVAEATGRFCLN